MPDSGRRSRIRILAVLIVGAGALLFVLANAHLIYVAVTSQPDCVDHLEAVSEIPGSFRAAAPAC